MSTDVNAVVSILGLMFAFGSCAAQFAALIIQSNKEQNSNK